MFDQALDNLRKATETTMQFQQEMFRQWVQTCAKMPGVPTQGLRFGKDSVNQVEAFQKQWVEGITGLLNKHRETLDAQYQAGVRTIEEAFRTDGFQGS